MILGLTYSQYVAVVLGGMLAVQPGPEHQSTRTEYLMSAGANAKDKSPVGQDGFFTFEARPAHEVFWGFRPVYTLGFSVDNAFFAGYNVRKDYQLGPVRLSPYFGPVMYQSAVGNSFESKEVLQFRTGFDFFHKITEGVSLGAGMYHISNAQITDKSAGIDVTHLSLRFHF